MKYITKIANNNAGNKTNLKYMAPNIRKISKLHGSLRHDINKYKRSILKMYLRQRYNFMESNDTLLEKHVNCKVTNAVVELVDIFPTIAELAGIPIPICQTNDRDYQLRSLNNFTHQKETSNPCSEGFTLLPLIKSTLTCQVRYFFYSKQLL